MSGAGSAEASTVDNYHVIELVGEGSFGKACTRCLDRGGQPVVLCLGGACRPITVCANSFGLRCSARALYFVDAYVPGAACGPCAQCSHLPEVPG